MQCEDITVEFLGVIQILIFIQSNDIFIVY